jgi:hypothetical protein
VASLERREIERLGQQRARERGLAYVPSNAGEYVSGRLTGVANLISGRFAMIESGLGFQLVLWQPLLGKRIGQLSLPENLIRLAHEAESGNASAL